VSRRDLLPKIWESERGLSAMLVFLVLSIFLASPLVATRVLPEIWFEVLFGLLMLSGVIAIPRRGRLSFFVFGLVLSALALRWASVATSSFVLMVVGHLFTLAAGGVLAALILLQVFREGPITGHRIRGSIAVYLLIGFIWTSAYDLVYRCAPGAFRFGYAADEGMAHIHDLTYYSFITLTTIGYGDIVPAHPIARSLAMAEGLIGQLYPAILIARLVSMELESRRKA
jgi:hypothetical protein